MKVEIAADFPVTDAACKKATGKSLKEWFAEIDSRDDLKTKRREAIHCWKREYELSSQLRYCCPAAPPAGFSFSHDTNPAPPPTRESRLAERLVNSSLATHVAKTHHCRALLPKHHRPSTKGHSDCGLCGVSATRSCRNTTTACFRMVARRCGAQHFVLRVRFD